jgi:hypothetical protein
MTAAVVALLAREICCTVARRHTWMYVLQLENKIIFYSWVVAVAVASPLGPTTYCCFINHVSLAGGTATSLSKGEGRGGHSWDTTSALYD